MFLSSYQWGGFTPTMSLPAVPTCSSSAVPFGSSCNSSTSFSSPPPSFVYTHISSSKGRGLVALKFLPKGQVFHFERPIFSVQHSANRRFTKCCSRCFRFVGSLASQFDVLIGKSPSSSVFLQSIFEGFQNEDKKEKDEVVNPLSLCHSSLNKMCFSSDILPCPEGCGEIYCSKECLEAECLVSSSSAEIMLKEEMNSRGESSVIVDLPPSALKCFGRHLRLCVGLLPENHPLIKLKKIAIDVSDNLLLVAQMYFCLWNVAIDHIRAMSRKKTKEEGRSGSVESEVQKEKTAELEREEEEDVAAPIIVVEETQNVLQFFLSLFAHEPWEEMVVDEEEKAERREIIDKSFALMQEIFILKVEEQKGGNLKRLVAEGLLRHRDVFSNLLGMVEKNCGDIEVCSPVGRRVGEWREATLKEIEECLEEFLCLQRQEKGERKGRVEEVLINIRETKLSTPHLLLEFEQRLLLSGDYSSSSRTNYVEDWWNAVSSCEGERIVKGSGGGWMRKEEVLKRMKNCLNVLKVIDLLVREKEVVMRHEWQQDDSVEEEEENVENRNMEEEVEDDEDDGNGRMEEEETEGIVEMEEKAALRQKIKKIPIECLFCSSPSFPSSTEFPNAHGVGFFVTMARMNHSCIPNVRLDFRTEEGDCVAFVTTKDCQAGEELCISYLSEDRKHRNEEEEERRNKTTNDAAHFGMEKKEKMMEDEKRRLRYKLGFECECTKCCTEEEQLSFQM